MDIEEQYYADLESEYKYHEYEEALVDQRHKLVDYINERERERFWDQREPISYDMGLDECHIISKKDGFIEWLVKNNKIDRAEIWSIWKVLPTYWYTTEPYTTCKSIKLENTILMVLAIKDDPLEFLASILK